MSEEAKDLLKKLLVKYPIKRITIEDAVKHPWFLKNFDNEKISDHQGAQVLEKLKNFRIKG